MFSRQGKVGNVIGVPLADGARQAVELYQDRAKPIPADIRFYLTGVFSKEILERAQFVIDDNVGSYGIINKFQEAFADNHAVTADNIIVFAKSPSSKDIWFWVTIPGDAALDPSSAAAWCREAGMLGLARRLAS